MLLGPGSRPGRGAWATAGDGAAAASSPAAARAVRSDRRQVEWRVGMATSGSTRQVVQPYNTAPQGPIHAAPGTLVGGPCDRILVRVLNVSSTSQSAKPRRPGRARLGKSRGIIPRRRRVLPPKRRNRRLRAKSHNFAWPASRGRPTNAGRRRSAPRQNSASIAFRNARRPFGCNQLRRGSCSATARRVIYTNAPYTIAWPIFKRGVKTKTVRLSGARLANCVTF